MGSLPRILPITVIDSQTPVPAEAGHHHDADDGPRSLGQFPPSRQAGLKFLPRIVIIAARK